MTTPCAGQGASGVQIIKPFQMIFQNYAMVRNGLIDYS